MLWLRLQQLRSPNWMVRSQAAEKLGGSGDRRAVPALLKAVEDRDSNVRVAAVGALGNIGDTGAIDPLIGLIREKDLSVRQAVVEALGKIREERVIETLLPLLNDKDGDVRTAVGKALEAIGGHSLNDSQRAACAVACMKWDEAASIGVPAIEPLLDALDNGKTQIRVAAIEALEKIGHERAVDPLIASLRDGDTKIQEAACWALATIGDTRAVTPLFDLARGSSIANVATAALWRLVERVVQTIPDSDLRKIAQLGKRREANAQMATSSSHSSGPTPIIYSNPTNIAQREMIRRGLRTGPQESKALEDSETVTSFRP